MISVSAVILALDAFGPVTDNAGGLAEMAHLDQSVRVVTDKLDAIGNITKATTKGYAVFSAALASMVLSITYKMDLRSILDTEWILDIGSAHVIAGLFFGAGFIALFSSMCLVAVNNVSIAIIDEVRRQFREMPGILAGTQRPEYSKAVDILTKASLKAMILPGLLPIIGVLSFFYLNVLWFGKIAAFIALGGFVLGATLMGILTAGSMTISGGAWDNAKKGIEEEGQKGTPAHQAAVIGDTVGDPYKDTAGPSINPMIKLIGIVSIILIMMHS
jgi:K(+)-stimulated pyrophosphate-energized sodium pump